MFAILTKNSLQPLQNRAPNLRRICPYKLQSSLSPLESILTKNRQGAATPTCSPQTHTLLHFVFQQLFCLQHFVQAPGGGGTSRRAMCKLLHIAFFSGRWSPATGRVLSLPSVPRRLLPRPAPVQNQPDGHRRHRRPHYLY